MAMALALVTVAIASVADGLCAFGDQLQDLVEHELVGFPGIIGRAEADGITLSVFGAATANLLVQCGEGEQRL